MSGRNDKMSRNRLHSRFLSKQLLVILVTLGLIGCTAHKTQTANDDPLESINRPMHEFNMAGDRLLVKPLAQIYDAALPGPVKTGVRNVFNNLREPATILNDILQGKPDMAARDTARFLINTTIGILGLLDIAEALDMPRRTEDFGQTLAVWGVPSGPYVVLPLLGPSTVRDMFGIAVRLSYTDPLNALDSPDREYALFTRLLSTRAGLLPADAVLEAQPDQYLFIREAWLQRRNHLIHDGQNASDDPENAEEGLIEDLLEE